MPPAQDNSKRIVRLLCLHPWQAAHKLEACTAYQARSAQLTTAQPSSAACPCGPAGSGRRGLQKCQTRPRFPLQAKFIEDSPILPVAVGSARPVGPIAGQWRQLVAGRAPPLGWKAGRRISGAPRPARSAPSFVQLSPLLPHRFLTAQKRFTSDRRRFIYEAPAPTSCSPSPGPLQFTNHSRRNVGGQNRRSIAPALPAGRRVPPPVAWLPPRHALHTAQGPAGCTEPGRR